MSKRNPGEPESPNRKGFVLWLTGLSGSGKSTLAELLRERLAASGINVEVLDGDVVRSRLSKGLGYSKEDRDENIRRIGFVAELLSRNGVATIVAAISPYRDARAEVRAQVKNFVEVYLSCPLETLKLRDPKSLYIRALTGELKNFTGVSDPYEEPLNPDILIDTSSESPSQSAERLWSLIKDRGFIPD